MYELIDDFLFSYQSLIHALGINGLLALSMYVVLAIGGAGFVGEYIAFRLPAS